MDILVCVKQVPDDYAEVRLGASGTPDTEKIEKVANAFDRYGMEMAARFCEANGGEVTAAAIGPAGADSMLKNLLAVGAKKAYLFDETGLTGADEGAVAAYLEKVIRKCEEENGQPYGAIFCGRESTDEISGQVGARLAERMGLPFVTDVIEVEPDGDGLVVKQETEDGYVKYSVSTPAVLGIAKPSYEPRYPNIRAKMAARKAKIPSFAAADAGIEAVPNQVKLIGYVEPPKRAAGVKIQEKEAADSVAKAIELMVNDKVL